MIYLYVKQHKSTGLRYFGKTANGRDPYTYLGSGKYWIRHVNKHGKELVETLNVWQFENEEDCSEFALKFSTDNNIVESVEWANIVPENGKDGAPVGVSGSSGMLGKKHTAETKRKISEKAKGRKITEQHKEILLYHSRKSSGHNRGKKWTEETKLKMSKAHKNKVWFNNEINEMKSVTSPGKEWKRGRLLKRKGLRWFNNGIENKMYYVAPDSSWCLGMIKKT